MQRFGLFLFLVVLVPAGVYWASHDFESPGKSADRFGNEVSALRGTRPPEAPTQPEPEPEPEPEKKKPEAEPPTPEPEPQPPTGPSRAEQLADAQRLFHAGNFELAALRFARLDAERHALAELGAAMKAAFPPSIPPGKYLVVTTQTGDTFEGFAQEKSGLVKLVKTSGQTFTLPGTSIRSRKTLSRDEAIEHIANQVRDEGASAEVTGTRVFALIQTALGAGRPDEAAPLLRRALDLDEQEPFFLSAVLHRAPDAYRKDLYRAFATCQAPRVMAAGTDPIVKQPRKLGNGREPGERPGLQPDTGRRPAPYDRGPKIESKKANQLMREARPFRKRGEKLYRKTVLAGIDKASLTDVNEAIRSFEKAIALYEKVMEVEDSMAVNAILRRCSKMTFSLRFWKQQLEAR